MKPRLSLAIFLGSILPAAAQTDVVKADNTTSMVNGGSWVGGVAPTTIDTAVFNDVFTQTGNFGTGSPPPSWLGFRVEGSTVTSLISVNNTTYANYVETGTGGIDMSASPRDFKVVGFNVNGNQTWNIASGRTLTLGGTRFSGAGDVDITGSGTVVINNNGSPEVYSGTLSVSGGTLDLNALTGGDVVVNTGGTLDSTVALPGNLTVNGGSATQTEAVSGDLVVGDGASFAGDVIVGNATFGASAGAILTIDPLSTEALDSLDLTLNGTNTVMLGSLPSSPGICDVALYSGTLTGGVANLQLDPAAAAGFRNAPVFDDTDPGAITLEFLAGDNITWTGAINADWDIDTTQNWDNGAATTFYQLDSVTFDDTASQFAVGLTSDVAVGSMTFSNPVNAYTLSGGSITVGGGINSTGEASVNSPLVLGSAQTFSAAAGASLNLGGTIDAGGNEITVDGDGTIRFNDGGSANQISNGGGIVKNGAGLLIMSGKNVNSGDVTVNAGILRLSNNDWDSPNFGGRLTINAGAVTEANSQTFGYWGRSVDINSGTLTLTGGGLYVGQGSGTCAWNDATVDQTNSSDIRARGTFAIGGTTPTTVTIGGGWQAYAAIDFNVADVTGDDASDFILNCSVLNENSSRTYTKSGDGTFELNAPVTLDGASSVFNVNAGTVLINSPAGSVDAAPWNVADGAALGGEGSLGGSLTLGASTGAGLAIDLSTTDSLDVGGDLTLNGTSTVSLSGTPNNPSAIAVLTFGGTLTGTPATALAVEPADAAHYRTTTFSTVGNTIILDLGSTSLTWDTGTWDVGNDSNWNGGTEKFFWGDAVTFDDTASSGSVTIDAGSGEIAPSSVVVDNSSVAYTFTGDIITGGASLTKNGSGTLTLSNGSNSYSNGTVINDGTLVIGASDTLPAGGDLAVNNPGVFDMAGFDQSVGALSGDGSITTGGGTLSAVSGAFSGVISGSGSLVASGPGTLALSGTNSYTGTTTIDAGATLQVGDGGTSGAIGSGALTNNGTLAYALSSDVTVSNLSGTGGLQQVGPGTMFLSDDTNTYSGGTTISGGTLQVGTGGTTGTLPAGSLVNDGVLVFERSDDITVTDITGGGEIVQQGTGTLIVDGTTASNTTSDYLTWFFNAGTVSVSSRAELHDGGISAANTVFTFDGGTLRFDGWNGGETFGGYKRVLLNAGGGTLSPDSGVTVEVDSAVEGTGNLTKEGDGTLVLSASNSFTGNTTISAGILALANGNALGSSPVIDVQSGSELDVDSVSGFTLATGQILMGNGDLYGDLATGDGTIAPGASAGTLTFNDGLTLDSGGSFAWEVGDWTGAAGTGYDTVDATALDVTSSGADPFTIVVSDTGVTNFTDAPQTFVLATSLLAVTGFDPGDIVVDDSGFASGSGTWTVSLSGDSSQLLLDYTPGSDFAGWIDGYFPGESDPAIVGFDADPDFDGISNGLEQFFGTAPDEFNVGTTITGSTSGSVTFTHSRTNDPATDVTGSYEWSSDLSEWNASGATDGNGVTATIADSVIVDNASPDNDTVEVTATITGGSAEKLFVRVVAEKNP